MNHVIILEGPDGGGKTTLANHLHDRYGYQVRKTNQPAAGEDLFHSYTSSLLEALRCWRPTVFDRHYLGECVYGPIMRGEDRLGEMGRTLIERLCAARGVPVVLVMPTWKQLIENWKAKKGADYLKNQDQLNRVHNTYMDQLDRVRDRSFFVMHRYDMEPSLNDLYTPLRRLPPGFSGYPEATVLMVGEQVNDGAVSWDLPFHCLGGSSRYIYDQVKSLGIAERDLAWANSNNRDGQVNYNLSEVVGLMPNLKRVVALGAVAMKVCLQEFEPVMRSHPIEVHGLYHPQYWKRFHAGHEKEYQQRLADAMGVSCPTT
jgi:uracil-DNA glycosylase